MAKLTWRSTTDEVRRVMYPSNRSLISLVDLNNSNREQEEYKKAR